MTLCEPVREGARWCVFVGVQATAVLPDDLREVLCPEGVLRGYVVDLFAEVEGSAQTGLVGRRKSPRRVELRVDRAGRLGEDWRVIGPVRALVRRDEPGQGPG